MDRRGFLRRIAGCIAGLAVAPAVKSLVVQPRSGSPEREILRLKFFVENRGRQRAWVEKRLGPIDQAIEQRKKQIDIQEKMEKHLIDLNRRMDG